VVVAIQSQHTGRKYSFKTYNYERIDEDVDEGLPEEQPPQKRSQKCLHRISRLVRNYVLRRLAGAVVITQYHGKEEN
jgi:hypothetical protein